MRARGVSQPETAIAAPNMRKKTANTDSLFVHRSVVVIVLARDCMRYANHGAAVFPTQHVRLPAHATAAWQYTVAALGTHARLRGDSFAPHDVSVIVHEVELLQLSAQHQEPDTICSASIAQALSS